MQANVGRLSEMQGYLKVRAPFAGVVTLRNVDVGAGQQRKHPAVSHRANQSSAHLFERAAVQRRRRACGPDGRRWPRRSYPNANSMAPSRARPTLWIPPAAPCWWKCRCPIRTASCCPACTWRWTLHLPAQGSTAAASERYSLVRPEGTLVAVLDSGQYGPLPARGGRPGLWQPDRDSLRTQRRADG